MINLVGVPLAAVRVWPPSRTVLMAAFVIVMLVANVSAKAADPPLRVPILVYHRFGPALTDDMTVTTPVFEGLLRTMQERGHKVVPLRELLAALADSRAVLPNRAVVLTLDDGHRTVYTDLFPLILIHRIPVTLFIYPTAISNASYALTWDWRRRPPPERPEGRDRHEDDA